MFHQKTRVFHHKLAVSHEKLQFLSRNYYWKQKIWSLPLPIKSRGEKTGAD